MVERWSALRNCTTKDVWLTIPSPPVTATNNEQSLGYKGVVPTCGSRVTGRYVSMYKPVFSHHQSPSLSPLPPPFIFVFVGNNLPLPLPLPHGKVEHKARSLLDPALYSERYIKQDSPTRAGRGVPRPGHLGEFDRLYIHFLSPRT